MNDVTKGEAAPSDSTRRLSIPVMAAYGSGELGPAVVWIGLYSLLLFYYQQIVGLSGTLTGLALGIALFCDAVTDPLVGSLSDRVKGRYGRRHPVMAASAIPIAITLFALFNPPDGLSAIRQLRLVDGVCHSGANGADVFRHSPPCTGRGDGAGLSATINVVLVWFADRRRWRCPHRFCGVLGVLSNHR